MRRNQIPACAVNVLFPIATKRKRIESMSESLPPVEDVKSCCAAIYSSEWARMLP